MISDCIANDQPFGVVLIRQGVEAFGPLAKTYPTGCTARIVEAEPLEDGRMNITVLGDELFHILTTDQDQPYLTGEVEKISLKEIDSEVPKDEFSDLVADFRSYLKVLSNMEGSSIDLMELKFPDDPLSMLYLIASLLQIPVIEKQPLLSVESIGGLFTEVRRLLSRENAILVKMDMDGKRDPSRKAWLN